MAGLKGKNGPPGNMNAFKHGLAAIQKRREESIIHRPRGERQTANSIFNDSRQRMILGGLSHGQSPKTGCDGLNMFPQVAKGTVALRC